MIDNNQNFILIYTSEIMGLLRFSYPNQICKQHLMKYMILIQYNQLPFNPFERTVLMIFSMSLKYTSSLILVSVCCSISAPPALL